MHAIVCECPGDISALKVQEMPDPIPSAGEVIVDVKAAGLNFPDILVMQGKYQYRPPVPFVPGGEGAGIVTAVGPDVNGFKLGDRVLFKVRVGSFATKISIPAAAATIVPDAMDMEIASGLTITYATALHALKDRGALKSGETLVVLGAAGGVGLAAIELGKAMGAHVIVAASTKEKLDICRNYGADELINYQAEDLKQRLKELTDGHGVDVIFDPVGGAYSEAAFRAMAYGGRHLVVGFAAGGIPEIPLNLCLLKQASLVGVFWGEWARNNPALQANNMKQLFDYYGSGQIKPRLHDIFDLSEIAEACQQLLDRKAIGKVILRT